MRRISNHRHAVHERACRPALSVRRHMATVGAFSIVEPSVRLDDSVELLSHVSLRGETTVGPHIAIGARTAIREHVSITAEKEETASPTLIGDGALIMSGCEIGAGTVIGNGIVIGSNSRVESGVRIDDGAIIGGLCHLRSGARIGRGTMIGGRLTVASCVMPFCLVDVSPVTGNPVTRGLNRVGLRRNRCTNDDIRLLQSVFDALFRNVSESAQFVERAQRLARKYNHGQTEEDRGKKRAIEMLTFILDNQNGNFLMR